MLSKANRVTLQKEKKELIADELQSISNDANNKDMSISIKKHTPKDGKPMFTLEKKALDVFVTKQVQHNIKRLYGVRQANRNAICNNVKTVLSDDFPKIIIKTDISNFYESVNTEELVKRLETDRLLAPASIKVIKKILYSHRDQVDEGQNAGLPRGIGISAYLAEFYLRDFDQKIRSYPSVYYYGRYVDDIFLVATNEKPRKHLCENIIQAFNVTELKRNKSKTQIFETGCGKFDFLGYRFIFSTKSPVIRLTKSKVEKYKQRIDLAFAT